jgi:hypothetical protein
MDATKSKSTSGDKRESRVPTPYGTHNTTPVRGERNSKLMKNTWLDIDKEGLRKSLGQKNKVFLLTEMVSNAWDEDITKVEVTLTRPDENSHSWLHVIDNSPTGWSDLSHAHTMFAESAKKGKSEKRGRFNAGEKDVLADTPFAALTLWKCRTHFGNRIATAVSDWGRTQNSTWRVGMIEPTVRCPYCILANESRPMVIHVDGTLICGRCGHTARPIDKRYECRCSKCGSYVD